ncbi:hypothetical protein [Pontibacter actiniarum]|uniref:Uncharacterized protein n=1 Tax=Pontibacter actiniarum TaxID=323450 RepID=A0A1X9YSW2_9BACT|nr:hypothetical protein [Pontibacter actiniarum]ARS35942.1 hypothetical protein CA264_11115 [Pontibacter actiniarum]
MKRSFYLRPVQVLYSALIAFTLCTGLACQQQEAQEETAIEATEEAAAQATAVVGEKRPAPEFFFIPSELENKRVWICEDGISDIFHLKHDCPILIQCKGKGSFRNLLLPKAIEQYGRYNCQECSQELDHIFDEDVARTLTN